MAHSHESKIPNGAFSMHPLTSRKKRCHISFALAQILCHTTTSHLLFATVYKEVAASFHKITNSNRTRHIFTE